MQRHYHIPEFQSIRGIAALVVLFSHSTFVFLTTYRFHRTSELVCNAHAAVMLFFVLSGYVLSRSLSGPELTSSRIAKFYLQRAFRIYPALWAACALAIAYLALVHFKVSTLEISDWYSCYFPHLPSRSEVLRNFFIANGPAPLVPPSWSIFVEMLGSLAIPVFVIAIRKNLGLWVLGFTVGLSLAIAASGRFGSFKYFPCFCAGTLAFRYQDQMKPYFQSKLLFAASLCGLQFFRWLSPAWRFDVNYDAVVPVLFETMFAMSVILCVGSGTARWLQRPSLVWLGDVSYSLYLLHFLVMSAVAKIVPVHLSRDLRAMFLALGTTALTLPCARLCYQYVEKPGIALGKRASGGLSRLSEETVPWIGVLKIHRN